MDFILNPAEVGPDFYCVVFCAVLDLEGYLYGKVQLVIWHLFCLDQHADPGR